MTCLRMVAKHYGQTIPAKTLRTRVDLSRGGISIRSLKDCAESIGLKTYGVKLNLDNLNEAPLPVILHWNQNHFAVLWRISKGKYYVADPAGGMLVYTTADFKNHFCRNSNKGIALLMAPLTEFYDAVYPTESRLKKIITTIRENVATAKYVYLCLVSLAIIALVADLCIPLMLRRAIDEGISNANITLVWLLVIGQVAIFLGSQLTSSTSDFVLNKLGLKLSLQAVGSYLTKLVSLPLRFFESRVSADLIQKSYDQEQMQQFILNTPVTLLVSQNGYMFSDTIARNIALGDDTPDMGKVVHAAKTACLDNLLAKMPLGLQTIIGPTEWN